MKRTPVKRVNRARQKKEFARCYHSKERVEFVKSQPCVYCFALSPILAIHSGLSHNAHTKTGGAGRKADYTTIVPLCASHHSRFDQHQFPFDSEDQREAIKDCAPQVEARYQAYLAQQSQPASLPAPRPSEETTDG